MSKLSWLRSWFVPAAIALFLCVVFVGFYLYWVPNRQRHLDDRGFRYLKTLSDQIRLTIVTYDKMLDNAVDSGGVTTASGLVDEDKLKQYLGLVAPQLVVPEEGEVEHIIGGDYDDPPKIAVKADEGTHFLYLAFSHSGDEKKGAAPAKANLVVRTDLDRLITGLVGPADLNPFDVVLLAQSDGTVIYQKSLSGVEVARIKSLQDDSGAVDDKKSPKQIDINSLSPLSRLEEVKIAGARYRLYSQPLQTGFLPANPDVKPAREEKKGTASKAQSAATGDKSASPNLAAKTTDDPSAPWVLCGLVRADRFRTESQSIPYSYILIVLAAILLTLASYPFLKLHLLSPGERLRSRDVTTTAVFACVVTAILTFTLADAYYLNRFFGPAADEEMRRLAVAINLNFELEKNAALAQLGILNGRDELGGEMRLARNYLSSHPDSNVRITYGGKSNNGCDPNAVCRMNILDDKILRPTVNDNPAPTFENYPYLFFVAWNDDKGRQMVKWTTRRRPTPFITLNEASVPYFAEVAKAFKDQDQSKTAPVWGIGSQYSATTGQNITVFWSIPPPKGDKEDRQDTKSAPNDKDQNSQQDKDTNKFSSSLVTQPVSLYNAVLPGGYQFAVLAPNGLVVFHTDSARNLRENFFAETDKNPDLRSRVRTRTEGTVVADYIGRPHRMYVLPMTVGNQDGLWTIVVFRDLHLEETMNLEILSLGSTLFLGYSVLIAIVLVTAYGIRRKQATKMWLWPDSRKADDYVRILGANGFAALLLLLLSHFVEPLVLLVCAGVIPVAVLVLNLIVLAGRSDLQVPSEQPEDSTSKSHWQSAYFGACATLLVAIALVPCLCFFKVVGNFQHRIFIERTQLQLASDLGTRAEKMRALYKEVILDPYYRGRVFAPPEEQKVERVLAESKVGTQPIYSYHEVLETTVCSVQQSAADASVSAVHTKLKAELTIPSCGVGAAEGDESPFLSFISLSYNEGAADDRHIAEGKSDLWVWSLSPTNRRGTQKVTMQQSGSQGRVIAALWVPFQFPWNRWLWWIGLGIFLAVLYGLVQSSLNRVFLLDFVAPPAAKDSISGLSPSTLIAMLPMNLLIIGPESRGPVANLVRRSDLQHYDAEVLLSPVAAPEKPAGWFKTSRSSGDQIDTIIHNGNPLVLRNFDGLPDDAESSAKANTALLRLLSGLGNSVIIISELDPLSMPSIEASERWRRLLRSFVRIDLNSRFGQRIGEEDADYTNRISADSYFHWLFSGLTKSEKLVMMQTAQEEVMNPNSSEVISDLMAQGLIERRWGMLTVSDDNFAKFLRHALSHDTVKLWEKEIAGARPAALQWSFLVLGVGVVAFLIYTQGELFNTWVTYATGVAAAAPKILQFLSSVRPKSGAKA